MFLGIILLIIAAFILFYLSFYFLKRHLAQATLQNPENQVCFGSNCFFVEIAKTDAEREQGLMNRNELDKNKGMLFIFDKEGNYPFWMKNTLIPLDMIWLDANQKVVFIKDGAQPCKTLICPVIIPSGNAQYVLEINSGVAKNLGIKIGDMMELKIK